MAVAHLEISSYREMVNTATNETARQMQALFNFYHLRNLPFNYSERPPEAVDLSFGWRFGLVAGIIVWSTVGALALNGIAIYHVLIAEKDPVERRSPRSLLLANACILNIIFTLSVYIWEALFLVKHLWMFSLGWFVFCVNMEEVFAGAINAITVCLCLCQLLEAVVTTYKRAFWISMTVLLNVLPLLYSTASAVPLLIKQHFILVYYADGVVDIAQWHGSTNVIKYARHVVFSDLVLPFVLSFIFFVTTLAIHVTRKPRPSYSRMGSRESAVFWRAEQPDDSLDDDVFHEETHSDTSSSEQLDASWDSVAPVIKKPQPPRPAPEKKPALRSPSKSEQVKANMRAFDWVPGAFLLSSILCDSPYYTMFYLGVVNRTPFVREVYALHVLPLFLRPAMIIWAKHMEIKRRQQELQ
ncbi:uncharacterized protein LOC129589616 [Paramacrobiotus metropolitanus]|uniref:uncharacterized protein LOC129589616 n=1 Tax=Paramacrobiotus metropolitanus TaxID=2943436 RepID=UPI002445CB91|nr:uncharacterized protein LOC129589616 [Paramacrobiotus metropolitanus]